MTRLWIALAAVAWPCLAAAQTPVRQAPGPYVIDLRGTTAGLPTDAPFYPAGGTSVAVPSRGLGFEAGAHVYPLRLGGAQVGVGAAFAQVRRSSADAAATLRLLAPQISCNFGSGNGWSHLSAGIGLAQIDTALRGDITGSRESGSVRAVNFGGGARWFLTDRAAVGFDVRFHRLAAGKAEGAVAGTPGVTVVTVSVGISLR